MLGSSIVFECMYGTFEARVTNHPRMQTQLVLVGPYTIGDKKIEFSFPYINYGSEQIESIARKMIHYSNESFENGVKFNQEAIKKVLGVG